MKSPSKSTASYSLLIVIAVVVLVGAAVCVLQLFGVIEPVLDACEPFPWPIRRVHGDAHLVQ